MRNALKYTFITAALVSLAACAGGSSGSDKAVDSNGNCTNETVSVHNDIVHKAQMYDSTQDPGYLQGVVNSCRELQGLLSGKSCNAKDLKTNSTVSYSYSDVETVCNLASQLLNPTSVSNTTNNDTQKQPGFGNQF